jgi:chemotaxis protein methyltransferase CheR
MARERPPVEELEARLLLEAIHARFGHDFRGYARASMLRRLEAARVRFGCRSLSALQERVLHEPAVLPELVGMLTVQVSEMFRDPAYFRALRERVLPFLATWPSLKVWVAGCGEGEELYSLVILFREEGLEARTLFYATDVSPTALRRAEAGIYPLERIPAFTENHRLAGGRSSLSDHYTAAYGAAAMDRTLRERVVFSDHSLASDEVFAELHLVSCRNVLIYFDKALQDRALRLFRDALVRGGFLGLGAQETIRFARPADAFEPFAPAERIWRRRVLDRPLPAEAAHG